MKRNGDRRDEIFVYNNKKRDEKWPSHGDCVRRYSQSHASPTRTKLKGKQI